MAKHFSTFLLLCCLFFATSCVVQHPKYTMVDNAMQVKPGMTLQEVTDTMNLPPYDVKERDVEGNFSYVWIYRPHDIKRLPLIMRKNKGFDTQGRFTGLLVSFNSDNIATHVESCYECIDPEPNKQKLGRQVITQIIATMVAIAAPALLVYFSLEPQQ